MYLCVCVCVCVCALGYQPTLKNTSPPLFFFAKSLINQKIVKAPSPSSSPLANLSLYILVFCKAL